VVFSTTLSAVQGNARLASGGLAQEIERLRAERGEGNIAIGGATLAAEAAALGLIDEYRARVHPVLVVRRGFGFRQSSPSPTDFLDDLFRGLVPDEWLRVIVPVLGPDFDRFDEGRHRGEGTTSQPSFGEFFEPPLD
jgi:hypothetical protein